jgi:hypothetical protein
MSSQRVEDLELPVMKQLRWKFGYEYLRYAVFGGWGWIWAKPHENAPDIRVGFCIPLGRASIGVCWKDWA